MSNQYPNKFKQADVMRREITLIHVAKQKLGMDDDTYRAMLWAVARVKSSTELDFAGRKKVLDHMKASGFKVVATHVKPKVSPARQAQLDKIEALLTDMQLPWAYLTAHKPGQPSMLKRLSGVEQIAWARADGLRAIITALMVRQAKIKKGDLK